MTQDQLYDYIHHPTKLNVQTLPEIKALLDAYPYCGTCMFLYLYNMAIVRDVRYASELRQLAPLLPSRKKLYRSVIPYLKPNASAIEDTASTPIEQSAQDPFTLIEDFLNEMQASGADLPSELTYPSGHIVGTDYFGSTKTNREISYQEESSITQIKQPVAQSGLATDALTRAFEQPEKKLQDSNNSNESIKTDDIEEGLFTETLAKIYIKQGRYDKALRIIRSISLNYPEKSTYFADQVRYLEKLINNEKQI